MKLLQCNLWNARCGNINCSAFNKDTKECNIESRNVICKDAPYTHEEIVIHNKWVKLMDSVERHSEKVVQREKE